VDSRGRRVRRPASPASSTASYEHDDLGVIQRDLEVIQHDLAVIQYDPAACDNDVTTCSSDRSRHQYHQRHASQHLTWPQHVEKSTTTPTPTSTIDRCRPPVGPPPCLQDAGPCPLDAASYHCRRCSAALKAISQSVCCNRRAPPPADVTSCSDVISSGVSGAVTAEREGAQDRGGGSQDAVESGTSEQ